MMEYVYTYGTCWYIVCSNTQCVLVRMLMLSTACLVIVIFFIVYNWAGRRSSSCEVKWCVQWISFCLFVSVHQFLKRWIYFGKTNTLYFHWSFSGANHQLRVNITSLLVESWMLGCRKYILIIIIMLLLLLQHEQVFTETCWLLIFSSLSN